MGYLPAVFLALTFSFTAICKAQDFTTVLPTRPGTGGSGAGNAGAGSMSGRPIPDSNASIPEPSTASLFLVGAAAALAFRKRK